MNRSTEKIMVATLKSDDSISDEQVSKAISLLKGKLEAKRADDDRSLLLSQAQTARLLNCSRFTIYRMVKDGLLKPIKIRELTRYKRSEVEALAA